MASAEFQAFEPAGASSRLRRWVRLLFIAVFVTLAAVLAASLLYNRQETLGAGERRAQNLALVLSNHFVRTVGAIDTTLKQTALVSGRIGGPSAGADVWSSVLDSAKSGVAGLAILVVVDETGTIRHATLPEIVGQSRADTSLFRQLAANPGAGLIGDSARRGQASGRWIIPFGRRLSAPDGSFAGIVVATLDPERLRDFYRTVDVGRSGFVSILAPDLGELFREPADGAAASGNPILAQHKQSGPSGFLRTRFTPDGLPYLAAYRQVAEPPVLIAAALAESDILAPWRLSATISLLIMTGFGALLFLAWHVITREIGARAEVEARIVAQARQLTAAMNKRDEADAALRANQARFASIMHHAPVMVSLKDRDGRYTFVNKGFEQFTGRRADELLGNTVADITAPDFAAKVTAEDRAVLRNKRPLQRELTARGDNGGTTTLLVKFPVFDDQGEVTGVGTVMTDITDQKRVESQLAQAQRIEAVGQLTGGIAHDFNNLLTSILLNADVLAGMLDDKTRPLAEAIRMAAERGADLTRRLLAFGRRQILEPRPTDVKELLTGMEPLIHRTLGEHIEIQWQHDAKLWSATVDPGQLENAVLNLALNARDAMPNGGRLTIETGNVEFDAEQAAAYPEIKPGQFVMIAVGDTGTGMPPDIVARAFEPFFTTKDVGKGTGLGLSMVYGFVKQSNGHARIYSEVGHGTVVRLFLPRSDAATDAVTLAPAAAADLPRGTETILFVEDDPMVREHTGRQIAGLGYAVMAAENGVDALAMVDSGYVPDLLFTDVVMPGGMNGRQLALRLRKRWPRLRVLYTSGYAHGALTIDGETVPTKYVLGKPYRRRDLAAKLREVLDEQMETV